MSKTTNTTSEDVRASVAYLYSDLLEKRRLEREAKEAQQREEREAKRQAKEAAKLAEDGTKKSKKERHQEELDNWKEVIVGLTGDDLEYSTPKKSKKKYKKWIDDEEGQNVVLTAKPKKVKKQNFQKQFDPELSMLKTIVADQNRFNADLQKRFNIAAGPATKDAQIPNKTVVELASVINAGRQNSLGFLREVGNLKKTIADLYMKQKKLDADTAGGGFNTQDIGLMGSSIASSIFGDDQPSVTPSVATTPTAPGTMPNNVAPVATAVATPVYPQGGPVVQTVQAVPFDPDSWDGPSLSSDSMAMYECIPHDVVVELNQSNGATRFKAIRRDNGEEIPNYPVPTSDISKLSVNEVDKTVKGEFDEVYKLEVV